MLYKYECPSGHTFEKLGGLAARAAPCFCGDTAERAEVNHFALGTYEAVNETRSDVRSFQEASAEVDYHYTKAESNGVPVKRPDLWKQAKQKVK